KVSNMPHEGVEGQRATRRHGRGAVARQVRRDDLPAVGELVQDGAPDVRARAVGRDPGDATVQEKRRGRVRVAAAQDPRPDACDLDRLCRELRHGYALPACDIDEAGEERVEALRMLPVREMSGLVDEMERRLALMRADRLE